MLTEGQKKIFDLLMMTAQQYEQVTLVDGVELSTGKQVGMVCVVFEDQDKKECLLPLAVVISPEDVRGYSPTVNGKPSGALEVATGNLTATETGLQVVDPKDEN